MAQYKLYLFGPPRMELDGELVQMRGRKQWALLAYLAVTGQPHSRDHLAALLWPDHDQTRARANLRRELSSLNKTLGQGRLLITPDQISLLGDVGLRLDVTDFQLHQAKCQTHAHAPHTVCDRCLTLLQEAVEFYTDDFLAGFSLSDSPVFDEWQFFQTESLRQALTGTLDRLAEHHRTQSQFEPAIAYARRRLSLDSLHEPAHRILMRLYALSDQHALALHQFEECRRILRQELDVAPDVETQTLYEAIRLRQFPICPAPAEQEVKTPALPTETPSFSKTLPAFLRDEEGPTPPPAIFVGRSRELEELTTALDTAEAGNGQLLFVIGGAGRGKTALVQEFTSQAQTHSDDLLVISGGCNAHTGIGDPYLPFREALALLVGEVEAKWAGGRITTRHARRLWDAMPVTVPVLMEHAAELAGAFVPVQALQERARTFAPADAPWRKRLAALADDDRSPQLEEARLFAQYTAVLKTVAARHPLLLILEDLHWIDTPSGDLLIHLSRELSDSRILLVGTYRPDELVPQRSDGRHPLANLTGELKRRHGDIWLDLGDQAPDESRRFVDAYLDAQSNQLGECFRSALFRQTGGHPLFTVELLREMQDRGDLVQDEGGHWVEGHAVDWKTLPARVEGVIEQRIDRLDGSLREVLTVASVEGATFTAEVVAQVLQLGERDLVRRLSRELDRQHRLVTAQSVQRLGQQQISHYRFRHYLFQHYVYHNLDETERVYLHEVAGNALEALYGEQAEQVAAQLGWHFEQAGLTEKTISALLLAGQRAFRLLAYDEANYDLITGLDLLDTLPDSPKRAQQELDLLLALVDVMVITQSLAAPDVERALLRARALCQQLGDTTRLRPVLHGLMNCYRVQAKLKDSHFLGEELLSLVQDLQDSEYIRLSHVGLGKTLHHLGEVIASAIHLETMLALDNHQQHSGSFAFFGHVNSRLHSLIYLAINRWLRGYPDQALRTAQEAVAHAREMESPYSLAFALHNSAHLHELRQEEKIVYALAEEVRALADEHGFPDWSAHASIDQGWAFIAQGHTEIGITPISEGIAALQAAGFQLARPYFSTLLAKGYAALGQSQKGLDAVAEGLVYVERSDERWCEAELHRLQGELLQMQNAPPDRVEACFERAIAVARSQQAKSWELRATMSLCRLWQAHGRKAEAHQRLVEIYDWFSEGFDTVDLIEARALLQELA